MSTRTTQNRTVYLLVTASVFFVITLAVLIVFFYFIAKDSEALQDQLRVNAYTQAEQKARLDIVRVYEDSAEERTLLASHILTEDRIIDFVNEIEKLAAIKGLYYKTESIDEKEIKEADFNELEDNFRFAGSEAAVRSMIESLEALPYHSTVTALSIEYLDPNKPDPDMPGAEVQARATIRVTIEKHD